MVEMLDYHLHYALMATEDRVRQLASQRIHRLPKRERPQRSKRRERA